MARGKTADFLQGQQVCFPLLLYGLELDVGDLHFRLDILLEMGNKHSSGTPASAVSALQTPNTTVDQQTGEVVDRGTSSSFFQIWSNYRQICAPHFSSLRKMSLTVIHLQVRSFHILTFACDTRC